MPKWHQEMPGRKANNRNACMKCQHKMPTWMPEMKGPYDVSVLSQYNLPEWFKSLKCYQ